MKIRKAQRKDVDAIVKLLNSAEELKGNQQHQYPKDKVLAWMKNPLIHITVCTEGQKIIGVLAAEMWKREGDSFLLDIVAHKDHRGKGCGSLLFEEYEDRCRKMGIKSMISLVRTNNKNMQRWSAKKGYKKGHALYYYEKKLD